MTGILIRRGVRTQVTQTGGVPHEDRAGGGYHGLNCVPHPVPNSSIEAPTPQWQHLEEGQSRRWLRLNEVSNLMGLESL